MWSDRVSPEHLHTLVARLHTVLPPAAPGAKEYRKDLESDASFAQVAQVLQDHPGFAYLNGTAGARLLHRPLVSLTYAAEFCAVKGPNGTVHLQAPAFDVLEAALEAWRAPAGALWAGFLSYDLADQIEDLGPAPTPDFTFPEFHFALYDSALTFDGSAWHLSGNHAWENHTDESAEDLLRHAAKREPAAPQPIVSSGLISRPDRAAFEASVEHIVATIHAGDIFQTNLCRRLETGLNAHSDWDLFQRLRAINPARYEAFLRIGEHKSILSISPEMFLKANAGQVESSPIKGTRPRNANPPDDLALSAELLASEKDRAELAMIVDVTRNDLGRVCETGSIAVIEHAALMTLPTVHHLYSTVRGRLRPDVGPVELIRAAFPAASITGAPKIEAMRVAMREEGQRRGPCMGAIGWIGADGAIELSVAIRTAFVADGQVRYYAGCGITADSNPQNEFAESRHKAAAFVRALGLTDDPNR